MKTKVRTLLVLLGMAQFVNSQTSFITTWQTTYDDQDIVIPTSAEATYNYDVDWENDGVFDSLGVTGDATHNYPTPGTHTIAIRGSFPQIIMSSGYPNTLLSVEQWGSIAWSSMARTFSYCANLVINATDKPNLANVTNMSQMFSGATNFNSDISDWDVSNITDMSFMFSGASSFNKDISNWDVSEVTTMNSMFESATSFNQDIGMWNVSNVTDMAYMFYYASAFNRNIGAWDVSNVNNMYLMFYSATVFSQNIGAWNVSNVTNMNGMFFYATLFNQDIGSWDVSNVIDMGSMFYAASSFNQDIGNWDVSNVGSMVDMFHDASAFDQNIGGWDISKVSNMSTMLANVTLSTENYDALLVGWSMLTDGETQITTGINFDAGNSTFCTGEASRSHLTNTYNWTISDGGRESNCSILSTIDPESESFAIYPNPSTGVVYIKHAVDNSVSVFNSIGQEVYRESKIHNQDIQEFNLNHLHSGLYFVKVGTENGNITKRLLIE